MLRDIPVGRAIRLCNVIKLVRGTWLSGHRSRGTLPQGIPAEICVNSKTNNVARGIHFPASGPNLRILAPQRVKRAQLFNAGPAKIAPARAEPSTNGKLQASPAETCVNLKITNGASETALSRSTTQFAHTCASAGEAGAIILCRAR